MEIPWHTLVTTVPRQRKKEREIERQFAALPPRLCVLSSSLGRRAAVLGLSVRDGQGKKCSLYDVLQAHSILTLLSGRLSLDVKPRVSCN